MEHITFPMIGLIIRTVEMRDEDQRIGDLQEGEFKVVDFFVVEQFE